MRVYPRTSEQLSRAGEMPLRLKRKGCPDLPPRAPPAFSTPLWLPRSQPSAWKLHSPGFCLRQWRACVREGGWWTAEVGKGVSSGRGVSLWEGPSQWCLLALRGLGPDYRVLAVQLWAAGLPLCASDLPSVRWSNSRPPREGVSGGLGENL